MTRVVVLGAGPAGLAASQAALAAGAEVTLIDEGSVVGGQFWRHHETLTDPVSNTAEGASIGCAGLWIAHRCR